MEYLTHQILQEEEVDQIVDKLKKDNIGWQDGKKSAGSHAAKVKNNLQLDKNSNTSLELTNKIRNILSKDLLVKSFAIPRKFHGIMFTRASKGQSYGFHIDNAYMSSGRSDLSFTLFLTKNNEYDGGELSFQTLQGSQYIKLKPGEIIIYPSTSLHSVQEVKRGERLACVGWIQSYVANNEDRNNLFGLDAGARGLLAKNGRSPELDLIFQSYSNLLRRLGD